MTNSNLPASQSARTAFVEICAEAGSTCVDEETAALSIGREFLPAFALVVLDKSRDLTPREECAYYEWLTAGVQTAIDENAATLAAGHEWSE